MSELKSGLPIMLFETSAHFVEWLSRQVPDAKGAWLRFAKRGSGLVTLTKAEAIDAAICHGWIDGQLDKYDERSWLIRFTPRKPGSKWSQVNRTRALELIAEGRMAALGVEEVEAAKADGRWDAAYASASKAEVPPDLQEALHANAKAAAFFATLTGANRYAILYRIGAVKLAKTRRRKIAEFVAMLERGETLHG
ncbi:MAG TPA: YdeI/OmpD-associated family protein [Croceibacterium sp.]|nr:YdeI/OmpD-associated family protein [Croceibacterium sp.]